MRSARRRRPPHGRWTSRDAPAIGALRPNSRFSRKSGVEAGRGERSGAARRSHQLTRTNTERAGKEPRSRGMAAAPRRQKCQARSPPCSAALPRRSPNAAAACLTLVRYTFGCSMNSRPRWLPDRAPGSDATRRRRAAPRRAAVRHDWPAPRPNVPRRCSSNRRSSTPPRSGSRRDYSHTGSAGCGFCARAPAWADRWSRPDRTAEQRRLQTCAGPIARQPFAGARTWAGAICINDVVSGGRL